MWNEDRGERWLAYVGFALPILLTWALVAFGDEVKATPASGVERWRGLVSEIFPAGEVDDVLSVMACESGGRPAERYREDWGQDSVGLMQINEGWLTGWGEPEWAIVAHGDGQVDLTDPATNLQAARWVRHHEDSTGKKPWSQWACQP